MNKAFWLACLAVGTAMPAYAEEISGDLFDLSLQELGEIEVTSVSKRSEKASEVAAAIHVITSEDIRRSSATSIPELLRGVPGLQVARAGSHDWAVSARGFNAQFANKLLVLIDGRTVYTPLFSGVFWDVQDTLLEDIDRIEVIRGPGGTVWGANAVNGVINIITKKAEDTTGNMARVTAGSHYRDAAARYGEQIDEDTHFRLYASYKDYDEYNLANELGAGDEWNQWRSGFRLDSSTENRGDFSVQGGVYYGAEDARLFIPSLTSANLSSQVGDTFDVAGAHVLSTWEYVEGENEYTLLGYYDLATRNTFPFEHNIHTLDLDFNHSFSSGDRHSWIWGLGYRLIHTDINSTPVVNFDPQRRTDNLFTAFLQDEIALVENELLLTLGSKFEHNNYTGFEWQPSARIAWLPNSKNSVWAAITRAVNTPSRAAHDLTIAFSATPLPTGGSALIKQVGNTDMEAEDVTSYELGYRTQPTKSTSFDVALFYNDYEHLGSDSLGAPRLEADSFYGAHLVLPFGVDNNASGETYGVELAADWQVMDQWLLSGSFTYLDMDLNGGSTFVSSEDNTPQHQFSVTSRYSFSEDLEWDNFFFYVDELGSGNSVIPSYLQFDSRLAWRPTEGVELSLVGKNLLDSQHPEFGGFVYQSQIEVPRTVFGRVALAF